MPGGGPPSTNINTCEAIDNLKANLSNVKKKNYTTKSDTRICIRKVVVSPHRISGINKFVEHVTAKILRGHTTNKLIKYKTNSRNIMDQVTMSENAYKFENLRIFTNLIPNTINCG